MVPVVRKTFVKTLPPKKLCLLNAVNVIHGMQPQILDMPFQKYENYYVIDIAFVTDEAFLRKLSFMF